MITVLELRKAITAALEAVHPRVYYEDAPDDAVYPYLVYDLPDSLDDGALEQFVLDVDGWDDDDDTTALETMMDAANRALDKQAVAVGGELAIIFHLDNRLSLNDDDPRLRRRKYVFQCRVYEKELS